MAHAQKPDFVLLRLKCDGTCAETRFRLTAFEMWWHMRRNQISSYYVWNVMVHAQKTDFVLLRLKCDDTCAETRFRLTTFEMWCHTRRNPTGAWIFVCCVCRVLSGRGLCDELITRPEESYRLCCVVVCDLETSRMGASYIYDISHLRVNSFECVKMHGLTNPKFKNIFV